MTNSPRPNKGNGDLIRYASMGTKIFVSLGLAVFIGLKTDKWLHTSPLLICLLPLLTLIALFYKVMKDTAKPPKDDT